ncbi:putative hydro-lyase [Candidatus Bipolaricaulota bacterium]
MRKMTGSEARSRIRAGAWQLPTSGLADGHVQANLVVVAHSITSEFEEFCRLNPRPLPLLEKVGSGSYSPEYCAAEADLRTDIPKYRIYEHGVMMREVTNLLAEWQDDWCAFLLGCSFTFDSLLAEEGIPVRHLEQGCNVPMYVTNRFLHPSGPFTGHLVVSMRPIGKSDVDQVIELTRPLELAHGEPIHIGSPEELGISELGLPDYGEAVQMREDEIPAFWACGVTAQAVAKASRIPFMVTHAPGYMFITDLKI